MFEINLEDGKIFSVEPDDFIEDAFHVRIKEGLDIRSSLHLVPLWRSSDQFTSGDYYQKTFNSYPKGQGHGSRLIKILLENIVVAIPNCNNIYSTSSVRQNNFDETDEIYPDATAFWESLIRHEIAERNEKIARYRILMQHYRD